MEAAAALWTWCFHLSGFPFQLFCIYCVAPHTEPPFLTLVIKKHQPTTTQPLTVTSYYIRKNKTKKQTNQPHNNNHIVKLKQCPLNISGSPVFQWLLSLFGPLSFERKASPTVMPLLQGLQLLWFATRVHWPQPGNFRRCVKTILNSS